MNPGPGQEFPTPGDGPAGWTRDAAGEPPRGGREERSESGRFVPAIVLTEMALYATPFSFRKGPYFLSVPWMCLISQFFRKFITSMLSVAVAPA